MKNIETQFEQMQEDALYFLLSSIIKECKEILIESNLHPQKGYTLQKISFSSSSGANKALDLTFYFETHNSQYLTIIQDPKSLNRLNEECLIKVSYLKELIKPSSMINSILHLHFTHLSQHNDDKPFDLIYNSQNNLDIKNLLGEKLFNRYEKEHLDNLINQEPIKTKKLKV
jgi:hypothetical protein